MGACPVSNYHECPDDETCDDCLEFMIVCDRCLEAGNNASDGYVMQQDGTFWCDNCHNGFSGKAFEEE